MSRYVRSIEAPRRARIAAHVLSALCTVTLVATGDLAQATVRAQKAHFVGLSVPSAFVVLVGLLLPLGLLGGLATGVADALAPPSLDARRAFAMWTSPTAWLRPAPDAWADAVATVAMGAAFFVSIRTVAFALATRFHDQRLAATVAGAAALFLGAATFVGFRILRRALRMTAHHIRPITRPIGLLIIVACVVSASVYFSRNTRFARGDWFTPVAACAAVLVHASLSATLTFSGRSHPKRSAFIASIAALLAVATPAYVLTHYTRASRVRVLTEDFARLGNPLAKLYQEVIDRDRDGYSPVLGGGDCDDGRADVHPSATDRPGDGLDADCFAGDGTPVYRDRTPNLWSTIAPSARPPNVLLITVDALRPDHLGAFGYARRTSPNIDAFVRDAVRFVDVTAQAPRTMRSMPAVFTGKYPTQIAFGPQHVWPDLLPSNVTLAEALSPSHATAVIMATSYFENVPSIFQGFTHVVLSDRQKAERNWAVDQAIHRIEAFRETAQPWFVWTHLFNVHEPALHDGAPSRFGGGAIAAYDTEVLLADAEVGRLLDHLRARGEYEDTIVVLASDHGEALGEHGVWGHSSSLYVEQTASVLVVKAPHIRPRTVTSPVALMDIFPTVLNLAGKDRPRDIPARSLVPAMRGDEAHLRDRDIFSEIVPDGLFALNWKAIRRGRHSLVFWPETSRVALFDRASDPRELEDIADEEPERVRSLLSTLRSWMLTASRREVSFERIVEEARVTDIPSTARVLGLRYGTGFVLEAVDVSPATVTPGATVTVDFYLRVFDTTSEDCFFDVFAAPQTGTYVPSALSLGHYPVEGHYRTNRFRRGELIRDRVSLRVPRSMSAPATIPYSLRVLATDRSVVPWEQEGRTGSVHSVLTLEIR